MIYRYIKEVFKTKNTPSSLRDEGVNINSLHSNKRYLRIR